MRLIWFVPSRTVSRAITLSVCATLLLLSAEAQTFTVLHTFTGAQDGADPVASLIMDAAGNLYGTAESGGTGACTLAGIPGCGVIFQLKNHNGSWIFSPLYAFQAGFDGAYPMASLSIGPNGTFYGTTLGGGDIGGSCAVENTSGCGTVFNAGPTATRPLTPLLKFRENVLYSFGQAEAFPLSSVVFDNQGNLYGTTRGSPGTVFELSPTGGGNWTKTTIYTFTGGNDGLSPYDGLVWDNAGNLYGTTSRGGGSSACSGGCGTVYRLSPSQSGWTESVIYRFQGAADGSRPQAGLAIDPAGNLYGNTTASAAGAGTVYELSPSGGSWNFQVLYTPPAGPARSRVILDSAGAVYETLSSGGTLGFGQVLNLTPSNGSWIYTDIYDFTNGNDGGRPFGGLLIDSSGNLFGTTASGAGTGCGGFGCGTVWEITP